MELSNATEKTQATPGIDPGVFRLVAQCLNHYATPAPFKYKGNAIFREMICCEETCGVYIKYHVLTTARLLWVVHVVCTENEPISTETYLKG
jgi:hypothetical protein